MIQNYQVLRRIFRRWKKPKNIKQKRQKLDLAEFCQSCITESCGQRLESLRVKSWLVDNNWEIQTSFALTCWNLNWASSLPSEISSFCEKRDLWTFAKHEDEKTLHDKYFDDEGYFTSTSTNLTGTIYTFRC